MERGYLILGLVPYIVSREIASYGVDYEVIREASSYWVDYKVDRELAASY